ncbi:MAG TPA: DUF4838 domain-containing protein [Edaphobacter sp.]|nr:DUF4838 domain-containing protein [Edaphobacter sp.]
MKSSKLMTRHDFLKNSGLLAAGLTFLPNVAWSATGTAQAGHAVSIARLAEYKIVLPDQASTVEQQAAERLQHYLSQITRKEAAITKESDDRSGPAFFIGQTTHARSRAVNLGRLRQDGFAWYPSGKSLIIAGGTGKGVLYGVYGLLELWGFRMYTSKVISVPTTASVTLPREPVLVTPIVEYRTNSYFDARDPEYANWHRLSSREVWGLFVHTFNELVSPDQYGKSHPEYFSLINGTRLPGTQLCLSNPEVLSVLTANLKKRIAEKPNAHYWSVSQNDNDQYCRCGPCTELNTKYGGVPSGSILYFVNDVARACPDRIISTLAYWYSRTPPKNIQAQPNVNIMLCNIESRRQAPVSQTDPAFSRELIAWGSIASNILIWDYNIQFSNLVSPFPNLHTLKPNIKFYTDHHVNSLFMQANGQVGGEMAGLRSYMISKLMWNPDVDDSAIMDEYLNGYYGPAGHYIRQYIDKMRESLISSGFKLDIFGSPEDAKNSYLSAEMMKVYQGLFDQAERATANHPELLTRVKVARLPILYAQIQIGRNEVDTPRSMFAHMPDGKVFVKPEMKTLVSQFVSGCRQDGVTKVRERSTTPDDYQASYNRVFTGVVTMQQAKSFGKKITPTTLPDGGAAKAQQLTDGIFGSWESWSAPDVHWVAYKGQHMDVVLDLGEVMEIGSIHMDFLNAQAQPDWNLLVLPKFVTYATSADGVTFSDEIRIANPHNPNPKENPKIAEIPVQPFHADLAAPVKTRYIKVHGESLLHMPSWHIRAGQPATLCTDQIVVL